MLFLMLFNMVSMLVAFLGRQRFQKVRLPSGVVIGASEGGTRMTETISVFVVGQYVCSKPLLVRAHESSYSVL